MDNCYKGDNQGQPRMSYRRGQKKDILWYNCNEHGHYSMDCQQPKRTRKEQRYQVFVETVKRIFWEVMVENNWKLEDFSVEETKDELSVSSSIDVVHSENMKPRKDYLIHQIQTLQCIVNNLSTKKRKTLSLRK